MTRIAGLFAFAAMMMMTTAPASAAKMNCTGADLQKVNGMMPGMVDGPNKTAMYKEMMMTTQAMSKGDMKGCAMHLNMAAKAGMTK
jgi:hypothetical protein